jgi:GTP diphosphokinase / guanosine-3',5'-bis(diphosphate) 3'-diphosphatase
MEENKLIRKVQTYNPRSNIELIKKACNFTIKAHAKQKRASGAPYHTHPFAVADMLADMTLDDDSIITALLHDIVEDTEVTIETIATEFSPTIAKLVDGVTKLDKIQFQPEHIRQAENFRKLLLAISEDIRVLLVKLADRVHNMRTIEFFPLEKRKRISLETMEIYAPLAERIGIQKIKNELQDLSFAVLHPEERQSIINRLDYLRKDGGYVVDKIESHINQTVADVGIKAAVIGREKTPCSIWQKMMQKNISFEQLSDIIAFRVIVDDLIDCYQILGVIHAAYHAVPGSFKDYISTPKENGYRSLHTVVVGPEKQRIEIQIRTKEMNEVNELGVAAHWTYKQGTAFSLVGKQFKWIRELLSILEHSTTEEFIEHTKLEMYEDQVFCFTPQGMLIPMPKGATPVDFAYALHSDIGHTCVGTKINGRIAPLRAILRNGDQVEIITDKNHTPSISWEKFVITAKARTEIKKFIRLEQRKEYINLGKAILTKFFEQEGYKLTQQDIENKLKIFHKKTLDDLYTAVGEGTITRTEVLNVLQGDKRKTKTSLRDKFSFFGFKRKRKTENYVPIKGLIPGMALNFASCCHPLPGDHIVGIVHAGKGIIVHTADCDMLESFSATPEKWVDLLWDKESHTNTHIGRIKITIIHQIGSLATITETIAKKGANISNIKVMSRSNDFFELIIDMEVKGVPHITDIIASLRSKPNVNSVERFKI